MHVKNDCRISCGPLPENTTPISDLICSSWIAQLDALHGKPLYNSCYLIDHCNIPRVSGLYLVNGFFF